MGRRTTWRRSPACWATPSAAGSRFTVREFLDKPGYEVLPEIEHSLGGAAPDDLVLIYYSGYGKTNRDGALCLATADTRRTALTTTSIPARRLTELVERSDCDQVVLLLGCCYSGAVEDGARGDVASELHVIENARGFFILTASSGMHTARETETASGGAVMGRFTAALVSGIEDGGADPGRTGKIVLSDLRRYVERAVSGQTPQFFARRASGDPVISLSPATAWPALDAGVLADLDAEQWHRRRGAVSALAGVLRDGTDAEQAAARAALQRRLRQERDYAVRAELEAAMGLGPANPASAPQPAPSAPGSDAREGPIPAPASSSSRTDELSAPHELFTSGYRAYEAGEYAEAARLYKLAADKGNAAAQNNLGVLYEKGQGVPQSYEEAARLYKLAADQGDADAQNNLGELYYRGSGVTQSYEEAARLYRLAADKGNASAQFSLGWLHEHGEGVPRSVTKAARLYKLAADQGSASAQNDLGELYY